MFKRRGFVLLASQCKLYCEKSCWSSPHGNGKNPAVFYISESWLDNSISDNEVCIPSYVVERKDRNREVGGICLFIKEVLAFSRSDDICHHDLELLGIDVLLL